MAGAEAAGASVLDRRRPLCSPGESTTRAAACACTSESVVGASSPDLCRSSSRSPSAEHVELSIR